MQKKIAALCFIVVLGISSAFCAGAEDQWVTFKGGQGAGSGKNIVLIAGDEEYRSEEGLPMMAKILATHHGFNCTVLFSLNGKGEIDPNAAGNIPGLEALDNADLMIILTRFRHLPDADMKHFDDFLKAGKPVIGLRTATHAFTGMKGEYEKYNNGYKGTEKEWQDGFGRLILGEKWISHHGGHKSESARGMFIPDVKSELLNGIKDGEIWGSSDVYGVRLPMLESCKPILLGAVCKRAGDAVPMDKDIDFGMKPTDAILPADEDKNKKNSPMMPIAWTKDYKLPDGKQGHSFTTTMGASADLNNEALRRLLINATYQLLALPVPEKANATIVGEYHPRAYSNGNFNKGVKPSDIK